MVNISNARLSRDEISLLSKGLTFCPTPSRVDNFQVKQDFDEFYRRLRLKEYFYDSDAIDMNSTSVNPFRKKSGWEPPHNRDVALETYIKAVGKDIETTTHSISKRHFVDNLTLEERKALFSLRSREDIVIKRADKGSATVVMSREDCHESAASSK